MIRLVLVGLVAAILAYVVLRLRRDFREDALARARAAFFVRTPGAGPPGREAVPMREVELGEGRLRVRVPQAWEGGPSTARALELRASSDRVFRAEVHDAPDGTSREPEAVAESLRRTGAGRRGVVTVRPGGRVLLKHVEAGKGDEGRHITYRWEVYAASADPPVVARFAFRVPGGSLDAITEDDLALLEREIHDARLSGPA